MEKGAPKEVLILRHVASEGAGTMGEYLRAKQIPHRVIDLFNGELLPETFDKIRAVLVMGGPMNVDEEAKHPFLKKEVLFIRELIRLKIPCLGVCLGSQLVAKALGARVYKAARPEIGWADVELKEAARTDRLFSPIKADQLRVLQWHEDTFDLPKDAVWLASSPAAAHQAYRYGLRTYGLQFHVEIDRRMLEEWFKRSGALPEILAEYDSYRERLARLTAVMYESFFAL